jgi:hypothetical protein
VTPVLQPGEFVTRVSWLQATHGTVSPKRSNAPAPARPSADPPDDIESLCSLTLPGGDHRRAIKALAMLPVRNSSGCAPRSICSRTNPRHPHARSRPVIHVLRIGQSDTVECRPLQDVTTGRRLSAGDMGRVSTGSRTLWAASGRDWTLLEWRESMITVFPAAAIYLGSVARRLAHRHRFSADSSGGPPRHDVTHLGGRTWIDNRHQD